MTTHRAGRFTPHASVDVENSSCIFPPGTDLDVALGDDVPCLLGRTDGVLARGDEHERLAPVLDVGLGEVERAVEPPVLVGEGVLAVGVGLDAGVELDRAVLVAEGEGGLGRGVERTRHQRGDVAHVDDAEPRIGQRRDLAGQQLSHQFDRGRQVIVIDRPEHGDRKHRRAGVDQPDRDTSGLLDTHDSTVGGDDERFSLEPCGRELLA